MSQSPRFWDEKFSDEQFLFGTQPNAFLQSAAERWLSTPQEVLTLGAGEGRNAVFLAREGHTVTAVDYSNKGLRNAQALAAEVGVDLETIQTDVRDWNPDRQWDAVVLTFLHLQPSERPALYELIRRLLHPGGLLVAEWFRPEQATGDYDSGGPPSLELMVSPEELRSHFPSEGIELLETETPFLEEGTLQGPAATVRFVWKKNEKEQDR